MDELADVPHGQRFSEDSDPDLDPGRKFASNSKKITSVASSLQGGERFDSLRADQKRAYAAGASTLGPNKSGST